MRRTRYSQLLEFFSPGFLKLTIRRPRILGSLSHAPAPSSHSQYSKSNRHYRQNPRPSRLCSHPDRAVAGLPPARRNAGTGRILTWNQPRRTACLSQFDSECFLPSSPSVCPGSFRPKLSFTSHIYESPATVLKLALPGKFSRKDAADPVCREAGPHNSDRSSSCTDQPNLFARPRRSSLGMLPIAPSVRGREARPPRGWRALDAPSPRRRAHAAVARANGASSLISRAVLCSGNSSCSSYRPNPKLLRRARRTGARGHSGAVSPSSLRLWHATDSGLRDNFWGRDILRLRQPHCAPGCSRRQS